MVPLLDVARRSAWRTKRREQKDAYYGCGDCYDYRSEFCYQECEYNSGYQLVHPCDNCQHSECMPGCPYHARGEAGEPD